MTLSPAAKELSQALRDDAIEILFQPQVDVASGRIVGAEALARWPQPGAEEVGAEALFAIAAREGLARELSQHVQMKALAAAGQWPEALDGLCLSVNITAADTIDPAFPERLRAMIDASGFPRERVAVEVTETELIENLASAAAMLDDLRSEGMRVALDDFGTGYSSLLYLKTLPLDALKIDKRLTEDIAGSPRDRIVVRGVIAMARALGLDVIAEGVETEEQLRLLAAEGCQQYQGYLCSPPVDAVRLAELVSD